MTMHWLPNAAAPSSMSSGRSRAPVVMETLSAPARRVSLMSAFVRMPPPTVRGMKHSSATAFTTSSIVSRPSALAVISRKTNSSAPAALYFFASSTGSPVYSRFSKLTPVYTAASPSSSRSTSIQGMIRFVSPIRYRPYTTAEVKRRGDERRDRAAGRSLLRRSPVVLRDGAVGPLRDAVRVPRRAPVAAPGDEPVGAPAREPEDHVAAGGDPPRRGRLAADHVAGRPERVRRRVRPGPRDDGRADAVVLQEAVGERSVLPPPLAGAAPAVGRRRAR